MRTNANHLTEASRAGLALVALAAVCPLSHAQPCPGPTSLDFATRVVDYSPAPGQFVNNSSFNDPCRALGPPAGAGGLSAADNTKCVTLGSFGGSITLAFARPVYHNRFNPRSLDLIVFGNAFFAQSDPRRRFAEPGLIEVSRDDNNNGLADDAWYVIPGSNLPLPATRTNITWSSVPASWVPTGRTLPFTTSTFLLTPMPFTGPVLVNANTDDRESVYGYADLAPTTLRGDLNADDLLDSPTDNPDIDPATFYTIPDDPFTIGITPGSGGGSAISLDWARDPATGLNPHLDRIDFVRISTALNQTSPIFGELSTEISAVADVRPVYTADWDQNGQVEVADIFAFLSNFFAGTGESGGADVNSSGSTDVADIFAFLSLWFAR